MNASVIIRSRLMNDRNLLFVFILFRFKAKGDVKIMMKRGFVKQDRYNYPLTHQSVIHILSITRPALPVSGQKVIISFYNYCERIQVAILGALSL